MATCPDSVLKSLGISRESLLVRRLLEYEEAAVLELAETGLDGRQYLLIPAAAAAWRTMKSAACGEQVTLYLASAFRSIARQADIIREKRDAGIEIDEILTICAPPGFSEHHTGCAVDIVSPEVPGLEIEFENTPAFRWLVRHAAGYGFRLSYPRGNAAGYQYEPWHWCYHGAERG